MERTGRYVYVCGVGWGRSWQRIVLNSTELDKECELSTGICTIEGIANFNRSLFSGVVGIKARTLWLENLSEKGKWKLRIKFFQETWLWMGGGQLGGWKWKWSCSDMCNSAPTWAVAYQAPSSMGFSRQEHWSGLPFPSPGDLPDPGIEPRSPTL